MKVLLGLELSIHVHVLGTDGAFNMPYGQQEHPVFRVLREPIHLQLELNGRSDPTLELFLDDCWATSNADPLSQPQWIVVADG